ncbi:MAG: hypothetical protein A3E36_04475 [Candidatus Andersenbacteria bacterium RIFCSPHIGHO2_12_FULL_45_11b]|uniref:DUF5666 domain-containing protein n=1 Tax=Candidatus Andersenbacteria bacterium RIFCSPHIGHO2_12_FULL_45_11b TaxID=1797282 RepID=A0A1G1X9H3_9BACT|nr:MAG: hypothetical protein A3E36_04475 [Candidatus Andersenbacteria bacterium RIFCSPHIGHO2_12_FULL_45_11b]
MKLSGITIGGAIGMLLLAIALASPAHASPSFVVRGIVDVKAPTKDAVYVTGTYASNQDTTDYSLNKNIAFKISKATVQKYLNRKLVTTNWHNIKFGQEVVMFGTGENGTYTVTRLVINDRSFNITGTVSSTNHGSNQFQVLVKTSSYKQGTIKNTHVTIHYTSKTKCTQSGKEIGCSDIANDGQKIKVAGGVTGVTDTYDATTVWNKY